MVLILNSVPQRRTAQTLPSVHQMWMNHPPNHLSALIRRMYASGSHAKAWLLMLIETVPSIILLWSKHVNMLTRQKTTNSHANKVQTPIFLREVALISIQLTSQCIQSKSFLIWRKDMMLVNLTTMVPKKDCIPSWRDAKHSVYQKWLQTYIWTQVWILILPFPVLAVDLPIITNVTSVRKGLNHWLDRTNMISRLTSILHIW